MDQSLIIVARTRDTKIGTSAQSRHATSGTIVSFESRMNGINRASDAMRAGRNRPTLRACENQRCRTESAVSSSPYIAHTVLTKSTLSYRQGMQVLFRPFRAHMFAAAFELAYMYPSRGYTNCHEIHQLTPACWHHVRMMSIPRFLLFHPQVSLNLDLGQNFTSSP